MKKKIESLLLILIFIGLGFFLVNNKQIFLPDYSDTSLVYENDSTKYYYANLTDNAKIAYTLILPELYKHAEKIEIPEINDQEFNAIMYALSYDNPDLICYGKECQIKYEKRRYYFYPTYAYTVQECSVNTEKLNKAVDEALKGIDKSASDFEKELYVHDYVCNKCIYELTDEDNIKSTAFDALVEGKAVCEGYSRATQLLLNKLGIKNYLVTGKGENEEGKIEGHMWNIVQIEGKNYHLDVTWDDIDEIDNRFTVSHMYFNVTDEVISRNHYEINPSSNNCVSVDKNYYNVLGMMFSEYNASTRNKIENEIFENVSLSKNTCEINFTDSSSYKKAKKELIDREGILDLMFNVEQEHGNMNYDSVQFIYDDDMFVMKFVFE